LGDRRPKPMTPAKGAGRKQEEKGERCCSEPSEKKTRKNKVGRKAPKKRKWTGRMLENYGDTVSEKQT